MSGPSPSLVRTLGWSSVALGLCLIVGFVVWLKMFSISSMGGIGAMMTTANVAVGLIILGNLAIIASNFMDKSR